MHARKRRAVLSGPRSGWDVPAVRAGQRCRPRFGAVQASGQGVREVQARQRTTGRPGRRSRRRPGRWVVSTQISLEGANPDRTGRHEPGSTSPQDGRRRLSKRGRRGRVIAVVVVVMVAAAGGAVYVRTDAFHAQPSATAASSGATTGLAQITKGNLAARSVQNGTLCYAGDHEVVNRASGTLTALPKVGDVVRTGKVLYRVDGKPVVLLKGAQTPVYRALSNGIEGADVQQLNAALVALGYTTSSKLDKK